MKPRTYIEYVLDEPYKGLGAIRAKIGPTSDVDKISSKMYSQYVLKDKANKRILRRLSFDNNGLVKPSCRTVALYGPFGFF
jgi:hypothetical protein